MSAADNTTGMRLLVADSFRVRDSSGVSEVRGFQHHLERFAVSVTAAHRDVHLELPHDAFVNYLTEAVIRIADYGAGNPRLELWASPSQSPTFGLSLRPLPELRETIELQSVNTLQTVHPDRKGPNITLFTDLNRKLGAEALLVETGGSGILDSDCSNIIEGATTALIWWEGEQGCIASSTSRVASITERLVASIAEANGTPFTRGHITVAELATREVWAVNSLHGIRPVVSVDGARLPEPDPHRLQLFREALDRTWVPVNAISHTLAW